eukprot:scaffold171_cov61-Phaeocystis_antarctica.AAC.1
MGCSSSKADTEEAGTAAAAGKAEPGAAAGGSGRKASEPVSPTKVEVTLDASQSTRVKELFTTWDIDASGKLELAAFTGAVTKVGPHQTKVLAQLQDMDVDHDGFVTQAVTTPNELPAASARPRAHCCMPPAHTHTHTHTHCTHTACSCPRPRAPSANAGVAPVVHRHRGHPQRRRVQSHHGGDAELGRGDGHPRPLHTAGGRVGGRDRSAGSPAAAGGRPAGEGAGALQGVGLRGQGEHRQTQGGRVL